MDAPLPGTPCTPGEPTPQLHRTVNVTLLHGPGVTADDLQAETRTLQAYYQPLGLRFEATGPPRAVEVGWLLGGAVDPASEPPHAAVSQLRAFLVEHAMPARDGVIVALLPRIKAPDSWADRAFAELRGLALSSHLDEGERGETVREALALEGAFTPTVLLSLSDLRAAPADEAPVALAHEVGHAFGLPHDDTPGNLMAPRPPRCVPTLLEAQVQAMGLAIDAQSELAR